MKYRWAALSFFLLVYLVPELWLNWELQAAGVPEDHDVLLQHLLSLLAVGGTALTVGLLLLRFTRDYKIGGLGSLLYLSFLSAMIHALEPDTVQIFLLTAALASFLPACMRPQWDRVKVVQLIFCGAVLCPAVLLRQNAQWGDGNEVVLLLIAAGVMTAFLLWERRWKDLWLVPAVLLPAAGIVLQGQVLLPPLFFNNIWQPLVLLVLGVLPGGLLLIVGLRGIRGDWEEWLRLSHIRYLFCLLAAGLIAHIWTGDLLIYSFALAGLGAIAVAAYFRQGGEYRTFRGVMVCWSILCLLGGGYFLTRNWIDVTSWLIVFYGLVLLIASFRYGWRDVLMIFFLGMVPMIMLTQILQPQDGGYGNDFNPAAAECSFCPGTAEQE